MKLKKATLSVHDVRAIAMANYERGGDSVIELWTDEDIMNFIKNGGTKAKLFKLFQNYEILRKEFA